MKIFVFVPQDGVAPVRVFEADYEYPTPVGYYRVPDEVAFEAIFNLDVATCYRGVNASDIARVFHRKDAWGPAKPWKWFDGEKWRGLSPTAEQEGIDALRACQCGSCN